MIDTDPLQVRFIKPEIDSKFQFVPKYLRGRFAKYFLYPKHLSNINSQWFHIIDQSYGHLLNQDQRFIVTVHDIIPVLIREGVVSSSFYKNLNILYSKAMSKLAYADIILTPSETTKRDLVKYLFFDERRIKVIPNAINSLFTPLCKSKVLPVVKKDHLPEEAFKILIFGGSFYKNNSSSIRAIHIFEKKYKLCVQLYCVGHPTKEILETLRHYPIARDIIYLSSLSDKDLLSVYNSVDCLLFPSLYEGFGWPPLEAISCGLPVLASNAGSLGEFLPNLALLVQPTDIENISDQLFVIASNGVDHASRMSNSAIVRERYSRSIFQKNMIEFYGGLVR